jgi:Flp pilus assembly pilin Flp
MKRLAKRQGFLAVEYAVLVIILVAALLSMSVYVKRSLCGSWRKAADTFGYGRQYQTGVTVEGVP